MSEELRAALDRVAEPVTDRAGQVYGVRIPEYLFLRLRAALSQPRQEDGLDVEFVRRVYVAMRGDYPGVEYDAQTFVEYARRLAAEGSDEGSKP